jgi:hypothetical protein
MTRLAAPGGSGPATTANNGPSTEIRLSECSFGAPAHTVSAPPSAFSKAIAELPGNAQALLVKVLEGGVNPGFLTELLNMCPDQTELAMDCFVAARAASNEPQFEALRRRLSPGNLPQNKSQIA